MAGIEKMYWTKEQLYEFYKWFFEHYGINDQGKDMLESITIYDETKTHDNIHAVTHFSQRTDKYLKKHCKLDFVQKRLLEQYGKDFRP